MQLKFLGLSVTELDVNLGRNGQPGSLTVGLVPDPAAGDRPLVPGLGAPVYFQYGALRFGGLLQRFGESLDQRGASVYQAVVVDPREVLAGVHVLTGGYAAAPPVPNVLNPYGYWEAQAFGKSLSTAAGMPWNLVQAALAAMCNDPAGTPFGGMLQWAGYRYGLDLRELPRVPDYYRVAAGSASLLDLIQQVCEDAACDFFVELSGLTVRVRVATRVFAEGGMGFVRGLAASAAFRDLVVSTEDAAEASPEPTAAVVTGGAKTGVHVTDEFVSYWGTDVDGNPVVGEPGTLEPLGACEFANLNALDCADVVGSVAYRCSTWEMRCALWGREAWDWFVGERRPDVARLIGAALHGGPDVPAAPNIPADVVRDNAADLALAFDQQRADRSERLFDLVRRAAEEFYGKQYLATVPGVEAAVDGDTGEVRTSLEPAPAGYLRFGAASLGVPANRLDVLQEQDERVVAFGYFADVYGADTSQINLQDTAVGADGQAWARAQVGARILFLAPDTPVVHVKLGSALFERKLDDFGDAAAAGRVFAANLTEAQLKALQKNELGGTLGYLGIHPAAKPPTALGIPLRSNVETYGPWYVPGTPGAVRVEQDPSLTPWDYGGEEAMDAAGAARAAAAAGRNQLAAGSLLVVGAPAYSPGDVMQMGGPTLTNLRVAVGPQGMTTQYRWQTQFTPRFGVFLRQNADRLRKASLAAVEARRNLRVALNRAMASNAVRERAFRGAVANKAFWERRQSPHNVLLAKNVDAGGGLVRPAAGSEVLESGLRLQARGDHKTVALMSMDGLVRGFTTNPTDAASRLPKKATPDGLGGVTADDLNFVKAGNDLTTLAWGQAYAGSNAYRRANDPADTRALALRGPIWMAAWGHSLDTKPVPGNGSGGFLDNYLRRSDQWKVGPLDPKWDPWRGVWSVHDVLDGRTVSSIAAGSTGTVNIGGNSSRQLTVRNRWSVAIPANRQCLVVYVANRDEWQFSAVDCSS